MLGPIVDFGLVGFGVALGEDRKVDEFAASYVDDPDRVIGWGYHTFHRAPDGITATDMATAASHKALGHAGVQASDLDLIVVANSEVPEYLNWDASAALARALGVTGKQTMLLAEGCSSGVTGLGMIAGQMALQPELSTALFVAVNRVSEYHRNRMTTNNSVHSDAAVAVVVRRNHPRVRWLATEQFTDPEFVDWFRTYYGGAVAPVPPAGWSSRTAVTGVEQVVAHFEKDPRRLREFGVQFIRRVVQVIDMACRRAGVSRHDVARIVYLNDPDGCDDIAAAAGVPVSCTNADIARTHGHMGAADQMVALVEHLERGEVVDGDLVALCGTSIGMRWCCTLVRI